MDLFHVWGGSAVPLSKGTGFLCFQPNQGVLRVGAGTTFQELCLQKPLER